MNPITLLIAYTLGTFFGWMIGSFMQSGGDE